MYHVYKWSKVDNHQQYLQQGRCDAVDEILVSIIRVIACSLRGRSTQKRDMIGSLVEQ